MKSVLLALALVLSTSPAYALKHKSTKANYTFHTESGKEISPDEALLMSVKGERVYKKTIKGYKTTTELVEYEVNEKGGGSFKAVK